MTTKAISRGWQGKQVSSFGNFRRQRKPNNPAIIQTDLQMSYDFGNGLSFDNTSTTIKSVGNTSFDGTLINGPVYSTTYNGICTFDGVNDYIERTAALNTGQNFTVMSWVRPTSVGTTRNCLVHNANNFQGGVNDKGWYFSIGQGGGTNRFFLSIGTDNSYVISSNNSIRVGAWQHLAATVSNGGSSILLYNNGILQTTSATSLSSRTIAYDYSEFRVGRRSTSAGAISDPFVGDLGSVSIYNRTLSGSEIVQNFEEGRATYGV